LKHERENHHGDEDAAKPAEKKIPLVFYATPRLIAGQIVLEPTTYAQVPGQERGPNSSRTVKVAPIKLELTPRDVQGYAKIDCKSHPATKNPNKAFAITPEQLAERVMAHRHFEAGKIITEAQKAEEIKVINEAFDSKREADSRLAKLLGRKANNLGSA
jgi:hypothetical protein